MKKLYILTVLLILFFSVANAQDNAKVVVTKIIVNGELIKTQNQDSLVFSTKDKIEFDYRLETSSDELHPPFRFMVDLRNSDNEKYQTLASNLPTTMFENLTESSYTLQIAAFDPNNQLKASPAFISFRVNDREVALLAELHKLQNSPKSQFEYAESDGTAIPIPLLILLIILSIFGLCGGIYIFIKFRDRNKISPEVTLLKENIQTFAKENDTLHDEINALRTQIGNLTRRAGELINQNNELRGQTGKLEIVNDEFAELQKHKEEIFNTMMHEIKNPAGTIQNLVGLLNSYDLSAIEQKDIISDILETSRQIMNVSREVSKILTIETEDVVLDYMKTDVKAVADAVIERNNLSAKKKNIKFFKDYRDDVPFIECDAAKLDEIIENLISNSIKFSPDGSKVLVSLEAKEANVEISVKDNGPGLSQQDIENAFKKGVRLSAKPTGNEISTGFGLWIVKKLTEAHQGRVKIASSIGNGSVFTIILPIKQVAKKAA